jgi:hypothetical protein
VAQFVEDCTNDIEDFRVNLSPIVRDAHNLLSNIKGKIKEMEREIVDLGD